MNKLTLIIVTSLGLLTGCSSVSINLGIENGQLQPCPSKPNCVNSFTDDNKQFIKPILALSSQREVQSHLLQIINSRKRTKILSTQDNYIRAEFTSKIFRFVDDVEFYFPASKSNKITIHVRSGSRVGHSDFGVNRARIETIRTEFKALNK